MLQRVIHAYDVLRSRSSLLLSLITICLTVTGFSGPRTAAAGTIPKFGLCIGMIGVFAAAACLVAGPFQLRWATRRRYTDLDASLVQLIHVRNHRTRLYQTAAILLVIGLFACLLAVVVFMLSL
jgi:hypothetical protein